MEATDILVVKTLDNNTPNDIFTYEPFSIGSEDDWDDEEHPENYAEWIFSLNNIEEYEEKFKTTVYELLKYNYQYHKEKYLKKFVKLPDAKKELFFREKTNELYDWCKNYKTHNDDDIMPCEFGEIRLEYY